MKKGDCIFVHFMNEAKNAYLGKYVRRNEEFLIMNAELTANPGIWRTFEIPIINIKSIEHAPVSYCLTPKEKEK